MTLINSLLHLTNFRNPFLKTLVPSIGAAFAIQTAVAIPSILAQSERFYDLSGSLTYLSVTALSLYLPTLRARALSTSALKPPFPSLLSAFSSSNPSTGLNWRQVLLSTFVSIWATRLGTYLFQRVLSDGHDSRFDEIKKSPPKFFGAFMAQATWVSLCLLPVLAVNSIPHKLLSTLPTLGVVDIVGVLLYVGGLAFEIEADRQKSQWSKEKKEKKHEEEFLTRGLWGKSRHPNYFGEVTLWTGIATLGAGVLATNAGVAGMGLNAGAGVWGRLLGVGLCALSPGFVSLLLFKVSGIPLSENKYDKKYGDRKDYQEWKKNTPVFFPKL